MQKIKKYVNSFMEVSNFKAVKSPKNSDLFFAGIKIWEVTQ